MQSRFRNKPNKIYVKMNVQILCGSLLTTSTAAISIVKNV